MPVTLPVALLPLPLSDKDKMTNNKEDCSEMDNGIVTYVDAIWEGLDGNQVNVTKPPPYDKCFQGF